MKPLGARLLKDGGAEFVVWAPTPAKVELQILHRDGSVLRFPMQQDPSGYWDALVPDVRAGTRYNFLLSDSHALPDPASRHQPGGAAGPSAVTSSDFGWTDAAWEGVPLERYIIYELHVGTFSEQGTFEGVIPHLGRLRDLGITAIELMPIAEFSGARNWGYDGVLPYAAQSTYGGPEGLCRLVDASHARGIAVVLDVVYNHIGPEHNHLNDFAPYFTATYRTPWGAAINLDGPRCDDVRRYFIENALYWITDCHIDALRLDAVHAMLDLSSLHFLEELSTSVHQRAHELRRSVYLIAESDLNAPRMVQPCERGGYGMDAQWMDDFHHALHVALTGEQRGYYQAYNGVRDLAKSLREGYVYTGQYSPVRLRRHGRDSQELPPVCFVVSAQNHDQVGNRLAGDRLTTVLTQEQLKVAAAAVLLSPFVPMLFMGEEYGERAPFPYFVSHTDELLVEAVRTGRRNEFADFDWQAEPPDPQSEATFLSALLDHSLVEQRPHASLHAFYRELIRIRTHLLNGACSTPGAVRADIVDQRSCIRMQRTDLVGDVIVLMNLGEDVARISFADLASRGTLHKQLDSADARWDGPGSAIPVTVDHTVQPIELAPWSAVVLAESEAQ